MKNSASGIRLAELESDAHLAELYRRLAAIEQRHTDLWNAGFPADERSHARVFSSLPSSTKGGIASPLPAQFEGRHRNAGGNELRAAALGQMMG